MATYCTPEDLEIFGVNRQALEGFSDQADKKPPIESTSDYMDGYLGKQFNMPFVPGPDPTTDPGFGDDIRECCAVITAWRVLRRRGLKPGERPEDSAIYLEYKEKIRWLEQIAQGKVTPLVRPSPSPFADIVAPGAPMVMSNESRGWQGDVGAVNNVPFSGRRRA